jgi:hypothetical protein
MGKSKEGECAYCGRVRELTRDHVPPQSLFCKPRPANLITVPACTPCNREYSKHDEYFHLAMVLDIDRNKFPKENAASVRVINNLSREESRGFALSLLQKIDPETRGLRVDKARIEIVLHRIVRGIFYHHKKTQLPRSVPFKFKMLGDSKEHAALLRESMNILAKDLRTIGGGVFRYAFAQSSLREGFDTVWLLKFYDHRAFLCSTSSGRD